MNLKQLVYFTAIAEEGNILAAARKLKLSQPPLSKQIQLLEEELGASLMKRGARKVELTEAGHIFYNRAKDILSMLDSTAEEIGQLEREEARILRLGCISSCGIMISGLLQKFSKLHPHVRFEVTEGNTYELLEKLKNGVIECAIVRTPFRDEGLICHYGREEPLMAIGRECFLANSQVPVTLQELARVPLIYYRRFEHLLSLAFQNAGEEPYIFCKNDDARTSLLWAAAGLGVALTPESISRLLPLWRPYPDKNSEKTDSEKALIARPVDLKSTTTRMAVVYKKEGNVSETVKALAGCIEGLYY